MVNVHPDPIASNNGCTAAVLAAAKIYCTIYFPAMTSDRFDGIASTPIPLTTTQQNRQNISPLGI